MSPSDSQEQLEALHGEKMIEVKLRFWTNDLAEGEGKIRPRHAWASGVVRMTRNKTHGIVPGDPIPFHSLLDIGRAVEAALIEHDVELHAPRRMRKYFSVERRQSAPRGDEVSFPGYESAIVLLRLARELHKRGYQKLRISPGLSPSGTSWRCSLTPSSNTERTNGAKMVDYENGAHATTAQGQRYFGWDDAAKDTIEQLADKFLQRYPRIALESKGQDKAYVDWFSDVVRLAEGGEFPIAYADWATPPHDGLMQTVGNRIGTFRLPPPGGMTT
jgi:hypothetical protein